MRDRPSIAVLVLDGFSMLSLGAIVEPFQIFREKFPAVCPEVMLFGMKDKRTRARSGVIVECEHNGDALHRLITGRHPPTNLFVCGDVSNSIREDDMVQLLALLRLSVRKGMVIHSMGSTTRLLAESDILSKGTVTIHWSLLAALQESHPQLEVSNALFVANGKLTSCAGELATLDLILDMIRSSFPDAAQVVADFLLISSSRAGESRQPGSNSDRLRYGPDQLAEAIRIMTNNIETPLPLLQIVSLCGISLRQLERLFHRHLAITPIGYYSSIRVERAYELLTKTNLPIAEIAFASGFASHSHLSKKTKMLLNQTPLQIREQRGSVRTSSVTLGHQHGQSAGAPHVHRISRSEIVADSDWIGGECRRDSRNTF